MRDRARHAASGEFERDHALERLANEEFDVLVIGGGVTGAGVLLDAASRGLRAALVEKADFASGTSSKSSKMIHGGLRYLQQREIRLVYENLAERQRLLENAPHLVSPLPFLIPLFGRNGVVSKTVARSYATALWLYDLTGGLRIGSRHRRIDRDEAVAHLPTLNAERLVAGFVYFDARADDARLTLTLVRTAVLDHGAVAANHAAAVGFLTDSSGTVEGVRLRIPMQPGVQAEGPDEAREIEVRARVVVNAAGVWADHVRGLGGGAEGHQLRPAKGVHVTVPAERLPCDVAAVIPVPSDRRSIFVVPWSETGHVYVGTTDTDYSGSLEDPECTPEDVDYLLSAVNLVTTSNLRREDVTGVWAGLRPLLDTGAGHATSARTADLSRRHTVTTTPDGVVTVTGGKLTTYRRMAQDTMEAVMRRLEGSKQEKRFGRAAHRCVTRHLPLHGAVAGGATGASGATGAGGKTFTGIDPDLLARLRARHGSETDAVLDLGRDRPDLLQPIVPGLSYLGVEVIHAVRSEMALTVDDVLSRRTRALLIDARAAASAAPSVAALLAAELGWSAERSASEATRFSEAALGGLVAAGLSAVRTFVESP